MELAGNSRGGHHGGRSDRGGGDHGVRQVAPRRAPRGYYVFCGCVTAVAAAVIAVNLMRHPGDALPQASGPQPAATVTSSASVPAVVLPGAQRSTPSAFGTPPEARSAAAVAQSSVALPASAAPTPSTPKPSPSPSGPAPSVPLVAVSAAVAVPARSTTPLAVRVAVVVPGEPPFPSPSQGLLGGLQVLGVGTLGFAGEQGP